MENDLLRCGFEIITEKDIPSYTGDDDDDLTSYENDNQYTFGYITFDNFCILHLDINNGDCVLRNKNGSSNFIIKYNHILYIGTFNEGEYSISKEISKEFSIFKDEYIFKDFSIEMLKQKVDFFYTDNF